MVYCTDTPRTASPSRPKSPPVVAEVVAPPRRRVATGDTPKVVAKPKTATSDWRDVVQASYRRNEQLAAAYREAGKVWGDENPYAAEGEVYAGMMRAYGEKVAPLCAKQEGGEFPGFGENFQNIMSRYDGAKGALQQKDPAAARKCIADAKAFHQQQLERNRRFAASLKAAADAQWGRK